MTTSALANVDQQQLANAQELRESLVVEYGLTPAKLEVIRNQIFPGIPDGELLLYLSTCKARGFDPLGKMLYMIPRTQKRKVAAIDEATKQPIVRNGQQVMTERFVEVWQMQTSIDAFRSIAESSGLYRGQTETFWLSGDGQWLNVWPFDGAPVAAKVGILREGFDQPMWGVARFASYAVSGAPLWTKMPDVMIAKVAEALAFRKAFPNQLKDIYIREEMDQTHLEGTDATEQARKPAQNGAGSTKGGRRGKTTADAVQEATAPISMGLPSAKDLQARYKAIEPEGKFLKWVRETFNVPLEKDPTDQQYHLADELKQRIVAKLEELEHPAPAPEPQTDEEDELADETATDEVLYCGECGGQVSGPGATGHEEGCSEHNVPLEQTPQTSNAPSTPSENNSESEPPEGNSTKAQRAKIGMLCVDLGITDDEKKKKIGGLWPGLYSSKHLSKSQATRFIDILNKELAEAEAS